MNIDNYINHWKNMILKESQYTETEIISEESKPSVIDALKLIKKITPNDEFNDLYSPSNIKSSIEKKYSTLSQEQKERINKLANNDTNYLKNDLTDNEEQERYEIYDLVDELTKYNDEQDEEYDSKDNKVTYCVTMWENDLVSNTEKFSDEKSAKNFITKRLRNINKDITKNDIGAYKASDNNNIGQSLIPKYIINMDKDAILYRYPKSAFEQDFKQRNSGRSGSIYLKEKDNPDSEPQLMNYWIDKYIEHKGIDKNNTEEVKNAKMKFRNAYNSGLLTGEKTGKWSQENFPILQTCDKNGNPIPRKKSDQKIENDDEGSKLYAYILYKQDMNEPKPTSKPKNTASTDTSSIDIEDEEDVQDEITSMDKSEEPENDSWYDNLEDDED